MEDILGIILFFGFIFLIYKFLFKPMFEQEKLYYKRKIEREELLINLLIKILDEKD